MGDSPVEVAARIKNLRKRLAQIGVLEQKVSECSDFCLTAEQCEKLERKAALEAELKLLVSPESTEDAATVNNSSRTTVGPPSAEAQTCDRRRADEVPEGSPRMRAESCRWEDDPVAVEDVAPLKLDGGKGFDVEILENVQPFASATQSCPRMRRLIRATSDLSVDAFETDVVKGVSRKGRWKLTLLVQHASPEVQDDPWGGLLGFIAYKVKDQVQTISIAKLAIVPESRGRGYGHQLVNWCIALGKKLPNIMYLSLTSLPKAIRFYKQMGFKQVDVDLAKLDPCEDDPDFDVVEGQIYMEYRCKGRGGAKKRR